MPKLKIHLLGAPLVELENRPVIIQRRKAQALLFYLALAGEPLPRPTLAALLWPESDQQRGQAALRRHLSELNAALGGEWMDAGQATIGLAHPSELWVDLSHFQQLVAQCRTHNHAEDAVCVTCIEPLTEAVALYRDDFLAGFTLPDAPAFDEWQFFQSEEARQSYAATLERLVQVYVAMEKAGDAIAYARRRLSLDPLHEPAHRQLMHLYTITGQQSAALRQYELCVQTLRHELDVAPAVETVALYEQIRSGIFAAGHRDQSPRTTNTPVHHNLPASTTPFIGRVQERGALLQLCHDKTRRLITILGPGGIGKTRMALEVAAQLVADAAAEVGGGFFEGIFFVRLAQLTDPAHITQAIAIAINLQFHADGRSPQQQLFDYLQPKQVMLVLDNFEHLLDGVGFVQELLQACPHLRLLATSRERLQLMGETVFTLGSLDFPTWELPQQVQAYDAIQLFIESAQRIRPQPLARTAGELATGHDEEMLSIARICRLVGGMPLGIILAASWVEVLSPAEIAAELIQGFDLLETELRDLPERQRSMRTVLAYSWQRLIGVEQAVFMRLAHFRGGFTRPAAEEIAGASLPILARLVDKSFVQRIDAKRYDVHELLRQFAEQQLELSGERAALQQAHATYYLNFLHACEARMSGTGQIEAMHQLEADFENIRAAWLWAVQTHHYALIDHALDALFRWFFWMRRSRQQDGLALLLSAQQVWASTAEAVAHPVWGRILARILEQQGPWFDKPVETKARIEQALAIAQQHGDSAEIYFCIWAMGLALVSENALSAEGNMALAVKCFQQCLEAYRAKGDRFWLGQTLEKLGHTYRRTDLPEQAVEVLEESLRLRREQGDRVGIARTLRELAWARFNQGMEQATLEASQAACDLQVELGDQQGIADSRFFLALAYLACGDWPRAKTLLDPVLQYATELNVEPYLRWASIGLTIAACMEENMQVHQLSSCSFPNRFCAFTTRLLYLLYSPHSKTPTFIHFRRHAQMLLQTAATDAEVALCSFVAAHWMAHSGKTHRAVSLISAALSNPHFAQSWIIHMPVNRELQARLRDELMPSEFAEAWERGKTPDWRQLTAELTHEMQN